MCWSIENRKASQEFIARGLAIALRHLDVPPRKRYAWENEENEHEDQYSS